MTSPAFYITIFALSVTAIVLGMFVLVWIMAAIVRGIRRRLLGTLLLEHIHALTKLGLPLSRALSFCTGRLSAGSRKDIREVDEGISEGGLLVGDALARVPAQGPSMPTLLPPPRLITPAEAETLRIGEMSGDLPGALRLVLKERTRFSELRNWLVAVCFYAGGILLVGGTVLLGIMTFIVPKFKKMFDELDVELPFATQAFIGVSNGIAHYWWSAAIGGVFVAAAALRLRRVRSVTRGPATGEPFQRAVFFLPYHVGAFRRAHLAEFCTDLAMLLRIGTPAHRALAVVGEGTMNPWFRDRVRSAAELCEMGADLPTALDRAGLDPRAAWFTRSTAGSEVLADALQRLAEEYRARMSWSVSVVGRIVPPLIVILLGSAVGYVVVALFLPLVHLMHQMAKWSS